MNADASTKKDVKMKYRFYLISCKTKVNTVVTFNIESKILSKNCFKYYKVSKLVTLVPLLNKARVCVIFLRVCDAYPLFSPVFHAMMPVKKNAKKNLKIALYK